MSRRDPLARWPVILLLLLFTSTTLGVVAIYRRRIERQVDTFELYKRLSVPDLRIETDPGLGGRDPDTGLESGDVRSSTTRTAANRIPADLGTGDLVKAAKVWKQLTGPERVVVDQVCLVPDVSSFIEALGAWDQGHFFPILIDEPALTLPFLRAFQPARVVRFDRRQTGNAGAQSRTPSKRPPAEQSITWVDAARALSRAWSNGDVAEVGVVDGRPPARLGRTPPGIILTSPDSPMFAGAVALAAGRFEALLPFEPSTFLGDDPLLAAFVTPRRAKLEFNDLLTAEQAWRFARAVERRVAALHENYRTIGDSCDFLTIAGDWPFRYNGWIKPAEPSGILALDDLLGRVLVGDPNAEGIARSRRRWAFTGRLLGNPATSVARAMSSLFLHPSSALLWNTYGESEPWNVYTMTPAAETLRRRFVGKDAVQSHSNPDADLNAWHQTAGLSSRFGMVFLNTSGGPTDFTIAGGPGHPADIPTGVPSVVSIIHSFSAAQPTNPETIAGRWLEQGAYAYYGSVHEPFVQSFRPPSLIADLVAADVPLVAALRQGEFELYGRPWRLMYLGDPLFQVFDSTRNAEANNPARGQRGSLVRLSSERWCQLTPAHAAWSFSEIGTSESIAPESRNSSRSVLDWCLDAAIARASRSGGHADDEQESWIDTIEHLDRARVEVQDLETYDQLLIETLMWSDRAESLWTRLSRIPIDQRTPRVWHALEYLSTTRLARLLQSSKQQTPFLACLDLWDEVILQPWPAGSAFPRQFTDRIRTLVSDQPARLSAWHDRLVAMVRKMAPSSTRFSHVSIIELEERRVVRTLNGH
jgi:hypothetical protein